MIAEVGDMLTVFDYEGGMASKKKLTKTDFVRSLPSTMSAKEIVEKAKAKGMTISEQYVYTIRTNSRRKGGASKSRRTSGRQGRTSSETTFRKMIFDLGVERARALVDEVDAKVQALIAGR